VCKTSEKLILLSAESVPAKTAGKRRFWSQNRIEVMHAGFRAPIFGASRERRIAAN
jgi:hypothetical protein